MIEPKTIPLMFAAAAAGAFAMALVSPADEIPTGSAATVSTATTTEAVNSQRAAPSRPISNAAILKRENDGHYWAQAEVDGAAIKLMVDTGASTVALTLRDAKRLGLKPEELDFRWTISTAGGETKGASVLLESIRIGQVEVHNVEAMVLGEGLEQSLLGMTFLRELYSYEFQQKSLILRQ